jgi:hypothetical protein
MEGIRGRQKDSNPQIAPYHQTFRAATTSFQCHSRDGMRHLSRVSPLPARFPTSPRAGNIRKVGLVASVARAFAGGNEPNGQSLVQKLSEKSSLPGQLTQHEADHAHIDHDLAGAAQQLIVLAEPTRLSLPREGPLDDPASKPIGRFVSVMRVTLSGGLSQGHCRSAPMSRCRYACKRSTSCVSAHTIQRCNPVLS